MFKTEKEILISKFFTAYRAAYAENVRVERDINKDHHRYIDAQVDQRIKSYEDVQRI